MEIRAIYILHGKYASKYLRRLRKIFIELSSMV